MGLHRVGCARSTVGPYSATVGLVVDRRGVGMTSRSCAVTPRDQASGVSKGVALGTASDAAGPKNPNRCRGSATYPPTIRTPIHPPKGRRCQRLRCAGDTQHPGVMLAQRAAARYGNCGGPIVTRNYTRACARQAVGVCRAIGLPLLQASVQRSYSVTNIRTRLQTAIGATKAAA